MQTIQITLEDVSELCKVNPTAAIQLENIALKRMAAQLHAQIADLQKNGVKETVIADSRTEEPTAREPS